MFKNKLLFWTLLAVFLKQLAWVTFVPLFQTPDEQAHFAEVSVIAETGSTFIPSKNISQEIFLAEKDLRVLRDNYGNNKYTYHPEFNISYSNTTVGLKEKEIAQVSKSDRKKLILNEATDYPKSYYILGSLIYKIFDAGSLFDRVFAVRLLGAIFLVALAWVAYKVGQLIFDDEAESSTLAILVGFMPMLSFVHSGVTSDTLFNLLFGIFLWRCLNLIKKGLIVRELLYLSLVIILSFWAKPQANIMAFIFAPLLGVLFLISQKNWKQIAVVVGAIGISLLGIIYRLRSGASFFPESDPGHLNFSFGIIVEHLKFTFNHTYHEVLPWFWGVFRWLSLAQPEVLRKITNFLTIISFVGFIFYAGKQVLRKKTSQKFWMAMFLLFSLLTYFAAITAFDLGFRQSHGYSFGIQGRYFFPVIIPFFAIFLLGLKSLIPVKFSNQFAKILAILMIIYNLIIFFWLTGTYYQHSFPLYLIEASQYKPVWLKFPINLIILAASIISSVFGAVKIFFNNEKK